MPEIAILCWEAGHVPRGLIQLESLIGNSTNLDTYPFPVRICRIEGANVETILENPSSIVLERMISESRRLIGEGIRAITTSCGFNAIFQRELTEALPVPVFTSSLLQASFMHSILQGKTIAVVTAKKSALQKAHLEAAGITREIPLVILGMEESPEWNRIFLEPDSDIDLDIISREVRETVESCLQKHTNIGAVLLECTDLPPFAQNLRDTTGLPVFDFQTLMSNIARSLGIIPNY